MSLILKSFYTLKLKKKNIVEICKLKDKEWKYGLKSQIKFFLMLIIKKETFIILCF